MGNFVRGGQLFLHALRMFHQVIKPVFLWSFIFWLAVTILLTYKKLSYVHVGIVLAYLEASMWSLLTLDNIDVTMPTLYGEVIRKSGDIPHIPLVGRAIEEIIEAITKSSFVSLGLTSILATTLGWYLSSSGKEKGLTNVLRGTRLGEFQKVRNTILTHNVAAGYSAYTAANMFYPVKGEMKHTIVIGTTGAGKTVLISDIVEQIRDRGDKAIIFDTKKCYIEWFYDPNKDYILNPYDERTEKWNIFKEITHSGQIKSIIEAFIPNSYGQDKVWNESARVVASTIIEKLKAEKPNLSNKEIADVLLKQDIKSMTKVA